MFKNIQNRLLLTNPLLWNLKIVPFAALAVIIHLVFFVLGYANGAIDFTETDNNYSRDFNVDIVLFIGVFISILVFIVWLVLYSRNNGFKSFYPKKNNSLFKEWMIILVFSILNVSYSVTFLYAKDLKARNYFSEEEINRRCEVIAMSSLFLEGSFQGPEYINVPNNKTPDLTDSIRIRIDSFTYDNRRYSIKSLIGKNIDDFTLFSSEKDSLNELKVKRWLVENKKDSVRWLFKEYFKITNEHHLKTNITPEKWLDLVYNAPEFISYATIGKTERIVGDDSGFYDYSSYEGVYSEGNAVEVIVDSTGYLSYDTISKTLKKINGRHYLYSKYYVSHNALQRSYGKISKSWADPIIQFDMLLIFAYIGFGVALLAFTFKITSGRNWLIAFVSLGIVGIVVGIISALLRRYDYTFPTLYLLVFIGLMTYFSFICNSKKSKGISGITLNQLLWMLPAVLPIIYMVGLDIAKDVSGYTTRYDKIPVSQYKKVEQFPKIDWLSEHLPLFIALNILVTIVLIYFISVQIKKWKGIPEA